MKKSLRQKALAYRKQLAEDEINALGRDITASLSTLLQTLKPCTVGLFHPVRGEPNALGIMDEVLLSSFDWALPVCGETSMGPALYFARYQAGDMLEAGLYNIPVPVVKTAVLPRILLIPCVAFHPKGARLGYGAGWYDRTLAQMTLKPLLVGVAYSNTELQTDFAEPHDQLLDCVVTEKGVIVCGSRLNQSNQ